MFSSSGIRILSIVFSMFLLLSFLSFPGIQNSKYANASLSIGQSIQQFQQNLQSSIDKEFQSIFDTSENIGNNCDINNNNSISIQSQAGNYYGNATSAIWNMCGNSNLFGFPSFISENVNLDGRITSSEYNINNGTIVNSIFGNWSLTVTDNGSIDFNATFAKQPVYYNKSLSNFSLSENNTESSSVDNYTKYHLSNFTVNYIQKQNNDTAYSGNVDVVKDIIPKDGVNPVKSNTLKNVKVSVSVFDDRVVVIQFDKHSELFNEFRNIPLVGIVK
ncbi:MAG: hypothetical protein AB7V56_06960 [Candidatus Nitrosocosmicus sp.]